MEASKRGLLDVRTFVIPEGILLGTIQFLQRVGGKGHEGFALWSGALEPVGAGGVRAARERFNFSSLIVPEQYAMSTERGLLVTVPGEALFEVNKAVHERGEILGAQVHSHPTDAYHSDTDDEFPLVTLVGALSIVIPSFGRNAPEDIDEWAWYRLSKRARWEPASKTTAIEIVRYDAEGSGSDGVEGNEGDEENRG